MTRANQDSVGAETALTQPLRERWIDRPAGYCCFEAAFFVGRGRDVFERAAEDLLHWEVKIRSGFDIEVPDIAATGAPARGDVSGRTDGPVGTGVPARGDGPVRVDVGQRPTIRVRLGPFRLPEPARIVAVVESGHRRGFTYATEPGHPVTGEESFLLIQDAHARVFLVLRSVSRPGSGIWRFAGPFVRVAQVIYRRRYARALRV